jgi:hypothetical protein
VATQQKAPKAPNLILAKETYGMNTEEQFRNQLRLYFNQLDAMNQQLLTGSGGHNIDFPHIAAYYDADQEASADDTATKILWNNAPDISGFTLNSDNTATPTYDGTYKIEYRLQAVNTDNAIHNVDVWLQVDGTDLANSATEFSIPARKSSTEFAYNALTGFVTWEATAGQKIALYWATEKAYISASATDGIYFDYKAAQTTPFVRPAIPSAYGVIQYIGRE